MFPNPYDPSSIPTGLPSVTTSILIGPQLGNPDGVSSSDCIASIQTTLDSSVNPSYYTTNYYGSLLMQYQQNPNVSKDPTFLKDYPYPEVINWILITSYA